MIAFLGWYAAVSALSTAAFLALSWANDGRGRMTELPHGFLDSLFAALIVLASFSRRYRFWRS
ncbi:MAG TPA: hypothetical protein VMI72_03365 [Roseiarcus sp.]|nr:hypothetical protein [Roseiarcus sp.]